MCIRDRDRAVDVPGLGRVGYDLAFGGAYYAYVEATSVGVGLTPADCGSPDDPQRCAADDTCGSLYTCLLYTSRCV